MNLHRVNGNADWASVPLSKRNDWQEIAAATHGVVTPGNFFSLLGLLSVPVGLWLALGHRQYLIGTLIFALGRLCDLADGWLADTTGTKSPLGEKIDAAFDKLSTGAVLIGLAAGGLIPFAFLALIAVPHLLIAIVAVIGFRQKRKLHPSKDGKLSMGFAWASVLFALLSDAAYRSGASGAVWEGLWIIGCVCVILSFALGMRALLGYWNDFRGR